MSLNRRVVLHAIDATPARWRGDAGSSPLDRARTTACAPVALVDFHTGADEIWDERARAEQRAGLSKEEAARRRHESTERDEAGHKSSAARNDSQARTEQFYACILDSYHGRCLCLRSATRRRYS